ncbi:MAG TPA: hypothetical protein VF712_14990 [Thermoleophilaceae bacterium]
MSSDVVVCRTRSMVVEMPVEPHVDRADGGHLIISPIREVKDRRSLPPAEAVELMWLSALVAEVMFAVLPSFGVAIGRINYQENGNWGAEDGDPPMHLHLYGRARDSVRQPFGQALRLPDPDDDYYDGLEPFRADELEAIRGALSSTADSSRYRDPEQWRLDPAAPDEFSC